MESSETLVNIGQLTQHNIPAGLNLCVDILKSFSTCCSMDSTLYHFLKHMILLGTSEFRHCS